MLEFPEEIQQIISREIIAPTPLHFLSRIADKSIQIKVATRAEKEGWSVKETERQVNKLIGRKGKKGNGCTRSNR